MSWKNLLACMRTAAQAVGWLMLNFTNNLSYGIASASPVHGCGSENTEKLDRWLVLSLFEKDTSRHTRPDPKHDSAYALILYYIPKASQSPVNSYPKMFLVIYCDMAISGERIITSESWRWLGWVWSARSEAGLGRRVEGNCPRCGCPLAANPPRSPYQKVIIS